MWNNILIRSPIFSMFLAFQFWSSFDGAEFNIAFSGQRGAFSSPNYPLTYPHNLTTRWNFTAPNGGHIQINFTDFNVEPNKKCLYDYVMLADEIGNWSSRICGENAPFSYQSRSSALMVILVSDLTGSFRGFHAVWRSLPLEIKGTDDATKHNSEDRLKTSIICPVSITVTKSYCSSSGHQTESFLATPCSCNLYRPTGYQSFVQNGQSSATTVDFANLDISMLDIRPTKTVQTLSAIIATTQITSTVAPNRSQAKVHKGATTNTLASSSLMALDDCSSNFSFRKKALFKTRTSTIILGILVAILAAFNLTLLLIWLLRRRRLPSTAIAKAELFDRILVVSKGNRGGEDHVYLANKKMEIKMDDFSEREYSGSESLE